MEILSANLSNLLLLWIIVELIEKVDTANIFLPGEHFQSLVESLQIP